MDIKWNRSTFLEIARHPEVASRIDAAAARVAAAAGEGYEAGQWQGVYRRRASVITATPRAMVDNRKNNTLARAMNAL